MGGGPLSAMTAPAITARLTPAATPSPQGRGRLWSLGPYRSLSLGVAKMITVVGCYFYGVVEVAHTIVT